MHIEYQLTVQEFIEASWANRGFRRFYLIYGVLFCCQGIFVWVHNPGDVTGSIGTMVGLFVLFGGSLLARYQFHQNPRLKQIFSADITEKVFEISCIHSSSHVDWAHFVQQVESKTLFLLYPRRSLYFIIPKRAFAPEDLDQFRSLISANSIPRKKRTGRAIIWGLAVAATVMFFGTILFIR